ncbi:TPP-binding enzyme conserved site [Lasiodiplodia theobromae]|nr:TPP-binding enzyme conserved site [Lasiodiplodia theobromae]
MRSIVPTLSKQPSPPAIRVNAIAPHWTDTGLAPGALLRASGAICMTPAGPARSALALMADERYNQALVFSQALVDASGDGADGEGVVYRELDEGLLAATKVMCAGRGPSLSETMEKIVEMKGKKEKAAAEVEGLESITFSHKKMAFPLTFPKSRELTGGDLLAQSLKQLGTEVAFGLHGGHLDAFLVGCETIGIRLVDTRHETVAVQAAESYAKMTGKTGVCFITANSGFSNGLPGLATAFADRSPILCITSSVPLRDQENNSLQGQIDQIVAARPLTKFAHRVTSAEDLPRLAAHAVHVSTAGAPGPVLLDIPIDVLFSPIHTPLISWGSITNPPAHLPGPSRGAVAEAASLIRSAARPVLILGTGAATSPAAASALRSFAAAAPGVAIVTSGKFARLDALYAVPTYAGAASSLAAVQQAGKAAPDCVVLLGARTGMYLGGQSGGIVPAKDAGCRIIQIDTDGGEIGRTFPVAVGMVSDAAEALGALAAALSSTSSASGGKKGDDAWLQSLLALRTAPSPFDAAPKVVQETGMPHPHHALTAFFAALPRDSRPIVVLDGGEAALWAGSVAGAAAAAAAAGGEGCRPAALMSSTGYLGFLGNGFGYALGSAVAAEGETEGEKSSKPLVILITGDGAAGFHFMELDSFARHGLRVLTVVVNNACWGMSRNGQDLVYGGKTPARPISGLSAAVDYAAVARGLGCAGEKCERLEDVPAKVRALLKGGVGAACLDLRVSAKPTHPGTEAMVSMVEDERVVVVPYYDNVPRPHYKL